MKKTLDYILETFTMIGCARAAAELARLGYYAEARTLMLEFNRLKTDRQERKESDHVAHSVLQ